MLEFTERVGVEPKVVPGVAVLFTEDKPEEDVKDDKKKHKKDEDGDGKAEDYQAQEHEKDGKDKKDLPD